MVIDSTFERGYQIKSADFNGDGLPDIAVVSDKIPEIYWYENPSWERRLISNQTTRNIDLAPKDIDDDGDIDLAITSKFNLHNSLEGGYIHWLMNDVQGISWKLHYIDSFPTSHRLRWADIDGDGEEELVNLPLVGVGAMKDDYVVGAELSYFEKPIDSANEVWVKNVIDTALHMAHGTQVVQWDGSAQWDVLTASFEGVQRFQKSGGIWKKIQLGEGNPGPRPEMGSSEVGLGYLGGFDTPFIATIEPWHGDKVVYYAPANEGELWTRQVIDSTFRDGHALLCADLNKDGIYEIIAGHRGRDYNLYIYQFDKESGQWIRSDLDQGGMSTAGLCLLDFNNDGFLDIAATGSATNNVVLYQNLGID
ncbi:MAG: VCBS repeat-containing protein [Bacteroidetes bacterium]|nr:VCBS repeat-containing protein [Bacteroidota bacterium]